MDSAPNPTVPIAPRVISPEEQAHYDSNRDDTTGKHKSGWPIENVAPPSPNIPRTPAA